MTEGVLSIGNGLREDGVGKGAIHEWGIGFNKLTCYSVRTFRS